MALRLSRRRFETLVRRVLRSLPPEIADRLSNVDVVVEGWPSADDYQTAGVERGELLLGLYHGLPLTERDAYYGSVLPDKIILFQRHIEKLCESEADVEEEVRQTLLHEIAHHFGIDEATLEEKGLG